jgi:hypothetical protein
LDARAVNDERLDAERFQGDPEYRVERLVQDGASDRDKEAKHPRFGEWMLRARKSLPEATLHTFFLIGQNLRRLWDLRCPFIFKSYCNRVNLLISSYHFKVEV